MAYKQLVKTQKRRGESLLSAYPDVGLSHALSEDKQLKSAHAGGYYT